MRANGLPGANVFLSVNESALQEHGTETETDDPNYALAYVESVPGAAFAVNISLDPTFQYRRGDLKADIYMDGTPMRSKYLNLSDSSRSVKVDKIHDGKRTIRRFLFAEHQTTDDKPNPSLKSKFERLGEVKVVLTRCHRIISESTKQSSSSRKLLGEADIPEKALKGKSISNHIELGGAEKSRHGSHTSRASYPFGKEPLGTYTFKYRSHRDLQVEGIIARSPSPVPLEDRDPQDLSAEEARELVRRMRTRGVPGVKLENQPKQERSFKRQRSIDLRDEDGEGGEVGEDDVTIVSINSATRGKRTRLGHPPDMEILDLTGE